MFTVDCRRWSNEQKKTLPETLAEGSSPLFRDSKGCFYIKGENGELLRANEVTRLAIPRIRLKKKDRLAMRKLLNMRKAEIDTVIKGE